MAKWYCVGPPAVFGASERIGGYKQLWMLKSYLDELEKEEIIAEKRKVG